MSKLICASALFTSLTLAMTAPPAHAACTLEPRACEILKAMQDASVMDTAAGLVPLQNGEILAHAASRFGYGLSSLRPGWTPDTFTENQLLNLVQALSSQADKPVNGPHVAAVRKAMHAHLFRKVEDSIRARNADLADFRFRASVRNLFIKADGTVDLVNYSSAQAKRVRNEIIYDQKNGATDAIRRRAMAEHQGVRKLIREPIILEPLLNQTLGSLRGQDTARQDIHLNLTGVLGEFWFNHFNIDIAKSYDVAGGTLNYDKLINRDQYTTFQTLLRGIIKSPAMLVYLDNNRNRWGDNKPGNQNLGRELLELHTFGIGPRGETTNRNSPYNQIDVEVAATILTGHNVVLSDTYYGYQFVSGNHFPGSFEQRYWGDDGSTVGDGGFTIGPVLPAPPVERPIFFDQAKLRELDRAGAAQRLDIAIRWLATHPLTRSNICRKLTERFVTGAAITGVAARCESAYGEAGNLVAMYGSIVSSPEIWRRTNYKRMILNPHEMVLARVRALGLTDRSFVDTAGEIVGERVYVTFNSMLNQIANHGLEFRTYGDPTGYEMAGARWVSTGYMIAHVRHGLELAHLDRMFDLNLPIRAFTMNQDVLDDLAALVSIPNSDIKEAVRTAVFGNATGGGLAARFTAAQARDIRDSIAAGDAYADSIRVTKQSKWTPSIPDSVLGRAFNTKTYLLK